MFKKKFTLLASFVCLSLILFLSDSEKATVADGSILPLTTLRLTDRESTFYEAQLPSMLTGSIGAHILWFEYIGFFDDSDLFYAQLPSGTVTRLSDRTATVGTVGNYRAVLGSLGRLNVAWNEDVGGDEGYDVFFWKTGMNTSINISDHALSNGDAAYMWLVLDSEQQAHVLWVEGTLFGSFGPNIFYWSEASGMTRKLSTGTGTQGEFNVTRAEVLRADGNTIHAVWRDLDATFTGGPQPFYWNSDTEIVTPIRGDGAPSSEGFFLGSNIDSRGIFHVIWYENTENGFEDFYWNSDSGVNTSLIDPRFISDGNGNVYVYYEQADGVYYLNTVNGNVMPIPGLASTNDIVARASGQSGNHFHVLWEAIDAGSPGHLVDLFYWRSDMTLPLNISDHTLAPADPANVEMLVDETDTVHVLWDEPLPLYYNNSSGLTTQLPIILNGLTMEQVVASDGVAYAQFLDSYAAQPPFYIWQSDTNEATPVVGTPNQAIRANNDAASNNTIWLDSNDLLHIAFEYDSAFYHWDELRGFQDLTADPEVESIVPDGVFLSGTDSVNGSYLAWQGDTVGGDGNDMYAAFVPPTLPYSLFLPLTVR